MSFKNLIKEYIDTNEELKNYSIGFIKCDIEGGEENILADVLNFASENNCRVWMSFHVSWWSKKSVTDFKGEFAKFYAICPKGDVCEYIKKNPFASVLLIPKQF